MELAYRSQKDPNLITNLSQLDKKYRSIMLISAKDMPSNILPSTDKSKICKFLAKDKAYKLSQYLDKKAISFRTQVGTIGSKWNILHLCVKNNSVQCLKYILKTQYLQQQQFYLQLINSKTVQNYTPIAIAILNNANQCLQRLLYYGGSDLTLITYSKMTATQIAFNIKNDYAIQLLSQYQNLYRKKMYLNRQQLNSPIIFKHQDEKFYNSICDCLISCFSLGAFQGFREQDSSNKQRITNRLSTLITDSNSQCQIDYVQIGSRKDLPGYDIQWKRASQVVIHHHVMLFDKFDPFKICQNNLTLKHNLIIFQEICKHSYVLRKLITIDKNRLNAYDIHIYPNMISQKIKVDDFIPFIKERNQPMFFSDSSQMWPMIVQKALAKWHHGYLNLGNIHPKDLMAQLTGSFTFSLDINQIQNINKYLLELNQNGFPHILYGKKNNSLSDQSGQQQCFSILNFYQKQNQRYALINCPFILQSWKQQQKYQQTRMKVIKGYYSPMNQMCVWIPINKFSQYFSKLIVSYSIPNYQRSQLKIKTNKFVFWKFRIDKSKDDELIIALYDINSQEIYDLNQFGKLKAFNIDFINQVKLRPVNSYTPKLASFSTNPGQYMCKYEFQQKEDRNLIMICWSNDFTQLQFVQQEFAILQWLQNWRKFTSKKWSDEYPYKIQKIGGIVSILLRQRQAKKAYIKKSIDQNCLYQGISINGKTIQMVKQNDYFYIVFKGDIQKQNLQVDLQI